MRPIEPEPQTSAATLAGAAVTSPTTALPAVAAPPAAEIRFTFTCQRCGSPLEGRSTISKQLGRCPTCAAVFVVPEVDRRTGLPTGPAVVADDGELPTPMHAYAAAGDKAPRFHRLPDGELTIICPRCDARAAVEAHLCPRCGLPFTIEGASAASRPLESPGDQMAYVSLTCGVLGLVSAFCIPVPVLGGIAIAAGLLSLRRARSIEPPPSQAAARTTGMLLGAFSILIAAVVWLVNS